MRFTLKQLEYFVAAGEHGSIKLAAAEINISQPSISSAITHLEQELQAQLFVRHHAQGLTLTSPGRSIMREAKLLLRQAQGLYTTAAEHQEAIRGELSVGCMTTLAPLIAPELGHLFLKVNRDVSLNIVEGNHETLIEKLLQVELDVALVYDFDVASDITYEPLASLPPHVLLSHKHPLAKKPTVTLKDLEKEPMVLLDIPYSVQYFLSLFENAGLTPYVKNRVTQQDVVRTMVANNYGYSIANVRPKNLTALDGRKLVSVKLSGSHKPMNLGIATLKQKHKPRILTAFEEHCRRAISSSNIPGMRSL